MSDAQYRIDRHRISRLCCPKPRSHSTATGKHIHILPKYHKFNLTKIARRPLRNRRRIHQSNIQTLGVILAIRRRSPRPRTRNLHRPIPSPRNQPRRKILQRARPTHLPTQSAANTRYSPSRHLQIRKGVRGPTRRSHLCRRT